MATIVEYVGEVSGIKLAKNGRQDVLSIKREAVLEFDVDTEHNYPLRMQMTIPDTFGAKLGQKVRMIVELPAPGVE